MDMEFEKVIRDRQSTRKFKNMKVEQDKLDKILEAGRLAPTAKNIQPQRIFVLQSEDAIKNINEASKCIYGAQTVLLVCCDINEAFSREDHSTYLIDGSIVGTHMMLEATNIGVDNIWIDLFDRDIVKDRFKLEDCIEPVLLLPIGYREDDCPYSIFHDKRKDIEETVSYL